MTECFFLLLKLYACPISCSKLKYSKIKSINIRNISFVYYSYINMQDKIKLKERN